MSISDAPGERPDASPRLPDNDDRGASAGVALIWRFLLFVASLAALGAGIVVMTTTQRAQDAIDTLFRLRNFYAQVTKGHPDLGNAIGIPTPGDAGSTLPAQALPVPTGFMIGFTRTADDMRNAIVVYSPYPMTPTAAAMPLDGFQRRAWRGLSTAPDDDVWTVTLDSDGVLLRYARADVLSSPVCVDCHNTHPNARRTDWTLGQTRGVIESRHDITAPIGQAFAGSIALAALTLAGTGIVRAQRQRLRRAERAAETDPLTQTRNRRRFDLDFRALLRSPPEPGIALMMCDIDHFKRVNDRYGHPVGDAVLCAVAETIQRRLRATDNLYRIGGEEFAVLLPGIDPAAATFLAARVRQAVSASDVLASQGDRVTISIGLTRYRAPETLETLVARADQLLYRAKQAGRDRVMHDLES